MRSSEAAPTEEDGFRSPSERLRQILTAFANVEAESKGFGCFAFGAGAGANAPFILRWPGTTPHKYAPLAIGMNLFLGLGNSAFQHLVISSRNGAKADTKTDTKIVKTSSINFRRF